MAIGPSGFQIPDGGISRGPQCKPGQSLVAWPKTSKGNGFNVLSICLGAENARRPEAQVTGSILYILSSQFPATW
jgi:hypothetical protein